MLEFKLVSKAHKYYHLLWWQFPIYPGKWFCYQSQHQPCLVSCRWDLFATVPHSALHDTTPIHTGTHGCHHLWWIVRWCHIDHMTGKVVQKCLSFFFREAKPVPEKRATSLPGLWAVWKAAMLCPGLKARWADRREAFPANRDSFQQPAYSVALEMPLISSSCAPA